MKYQDLSRFTMPIGFRGKSGVYVQLWWIVQSTLFAGSPQFMYAWRSFLLRLFGAKIGKGVIIRPSVRVTYPWKVDVGDYVWIGDNVELYSLGKITIGSHSVISQRSYLCTGGHNHNSISFDIFEKPITIAEEVWIASDVFVSPGVSIGRGVLVAARSSVFHDLPEGMICLGAPAKPVKKRLAK